jgi:hypothetical protein
MSERKAIRPKKNYTPAELDLAIQENKYIYNQYFKPEFMKTLNEVFFYEMSQAYFRPVYVGFEQDTQRNVDAHPVIFASNHSGMAFPWDAMVFGSGYFKDRDYEEKRCFRTLVAPMLSQTPTMHPFTLLDGWKSAGGIDATYLNFETMMQLPEGNLLIYPEGVPGIGKGFNRKYQLQRFATSFIKMSLKYKTDIVPYSTINAEYVAPFLYSSNWFNKQINKIGVPFFPLGLLTLFLIFPFAFYLAFPCKMYFVRGQRISPYLWSTKPYEEMTEDDINDICHKVRASMQNDLDLAVSTYGKKAYHWREFFASMWAHIKRFPYNTPLGWAFMFHEFERQWFYEGGREGKKQVKIYTGWGAILLLLFRNPITLAYFIPIIGWFILAWYGKRKWKNKPY